jgi:hypothetical protein
MPPSPAPVDSTVGTSVRASANPTGSAADASNPPVAGQTLDNQMGAVLVAQQAFARGDFAQTRLLAVAALNQNPDAASRDALKLLIARTHPDPVARWVLGIAAVTVLVVTLIAYWQGRAALH